MVLLIHLGRPLHAWVNEVVLFVPVTILLVADNPLMAGGRGTYLTRTTELLATAFLSCCFLSGALFNLWGIPGVAHVSVV